MLSWNFACCCWELISLGLFHLMIRLWSIYLLVPIKNKKCRELSFASPSIFFLTINVDATWIPFKGLSCWCWFHSSNCWTSYYYRGFEISKISLEFRYRKFLSSHIATEPYTWSLENKPANKSAKSNRWSPKCEKFFR